MLSVALIPVVWVTSEECRIVHIIGQPKLTHRLRAAGTEVNFSVNIAPEFHDARTI